MKNNNKQTHRKFLQLINKYGPTAILISHLSHSIYRENMEDEIKLAHKEFIKYETKK